MTASPALPRRVARVIVRPRAARLTLASPLLLALAACGGGPVDYDLRGVMGNSPFDTSEAAVNATAARPLPDDRGIISYPNYQVAIARRGDTLATLAQRIGLAAGELARFNGIRPDDPLRQGEVIALPTRVAEPSPATGAPTTGPIRPASEIDVNAIAGEALDRADPPAASPQAAPPPRAAAAQTGPEPVRHQVQRGETAFSISRLYGVSVRALAEWNGLDAEFTVRTGQFLLIPPRADTGSERADAGPSAPSAPGAGSPTPVPPSASAPLPAEVPPAAAEPVAVPDSPALETSAPETSDARMSFPVEGSIIREYAKGRNEGIGIAAPTGTTVRAAEAGTVAAITSDADQVPIVVLKHADNLLTVYANVAEISVSRGESVARGQGIGAVGPGDPSFLHFEVREGFESVDPMPYLR